VIRMALVFQYGSNCSNRRLNAADRLNGDAILLGRAVLSGYKLVFDVWSDRNACAASDIVEATGSIVEGVLYEVPDSLIQRETAPPGRRSFDSIEGTRYERRSVSVRRPDGSRVDAITYAAHPSHRRHNIRTCLAYVRHIVTGLRENGADPGYIDELRHTASENNPAIANDIAAL
jgi:hypothetical protein